MRIEGEEIGTETIAEVEDDNKDLNRPCSNGDVVWTVHFRKKGQSP